MPPTVVTPAQLLDLDATAVLAAYRAGALKPSEAVEGYIAHQQRFQPKLNLITEDRYAAARDEARRCDELLAAGKIEGKLFGVPMSIKEAYDVAGMHTTCGLKHRKDVVATADAEAVRRVRAEGAIVLDKTNTPTLCFCQETDNYLFGRSNNPWNPAHTTGGSSGGEAALIAVGGAAAGLGSDIGGSIRIPSHFNGVIGFKPGNGQFPAEGHIPGAATAYQARMLGFGPIVKSVRDAALLYSIVHPPFTPPSDWSLPAGLRVVSFGSFHKTVCSFETLQTLANAQAALNGAGAQLVATPPAFMNDIALVWQLAMSEDKGKAVIDMAYPGRPKAFFGDWLRAKLGMEAENHPFLSWAILGTNLFPPNAQQEKWFKQEMDEGPGRVAELLGDNGVFVIPAYPTPAKRHGQVYAELFAIQKSFRWLLPFIALPNAYGLPSMVVPCGRSGDGLPIGLQVVGTVGREQLVCRVAAFLEAKLGGWRRCTAYDAA